MVLGHVTSTASCAKNNLKVPQVWASGIGLAKRRGNKPLRREEETTVDSGYDKFPFVGNWSAGARYRYLVQTASEGTGFTAVGQEEPQLNCL